MLSNETKRRAYDSQLPFDESIPTLERVQKALEKGDHKFIKLFAPVFARNARFAVHKPVPDIGNMETPLPQVYKFYDYWVKFESWRDFTGVGADHKPDDAGSREEKRYYQKENEKLAKKLKKKEMERIIALVALAQENDPRINADKERRRIAKENEKNSKESLLKRKAEEEALSKAWDAQLEADALSLKGATKEDREKVKKLQSKARNTLRKQLRFSATLGHGNAGEYGVVSDADMELLCSNCNLSDLNDMTTALGGEPAAKEASALLPTGFPVVMEKLEDSRNAAVHAQEDEVIAKEVKKMEATFKLNAEKKKSGAAAGDGKVWADAELDLLKAAVRRYPAGTPTRWQAVVNFLNFHMKPTESYKPDECLRAAYLIAHPVA